jgi:hypothetical protein
MRYPVVKVKKISQKILMHFPKCVRYLSSMNSLSLRVRGTSLARSSPPWVYMQEVTSVKLLLMDSRRRED